MPWSVLEMWVLHFQQLTDQISNVHKWPSLTCTQSYGREGTEVQEQHKQHKTWKQRNSIRHQESKRKKHHKCPGWKACPFPFWTIHTHKQKHKEALHTQLVALWRRRCECASSGRLLQCTPSRSRHAPAFGSMQTGWSGRDGATCWQPQRCASHT